MASKMKVIFELNTNQGSKIKQVTMHPVKKWIGIINENNTFSLWNYQQKILIKSFSCNTLCDNKIVQIKQIVFFDKYSLCSYQENRGMRSNIIFVTNSKVIFYDYMTDAIRQTEQKELDQKTIRKVCVYSQYKVCIAMSDGTFKILDTREATNKGSLQIRTVRGYHVKPITWIFPYSQNYNQMPRVITASDQDGLMACWNIDMIMKNPPNIELATPSFKFHSSTKKQNIMNQDITFLQYDPSTYRLITLNDQYIRLWSTMTGMELKRIKNSFKCKQIVFFNHFTFTNQSFIGHSKSSKILMIRNNNGQLLINNQTQLRNFFQGPYSQNPQEQPYISHIYSLPQHPSNLFLVTNFNMSILEIDKFYSAPYGVHPSFSTKLSTINSRDLILKSQGELRKNISAQQIMGLKFEDDILINSFFLSVDQDYLYFNLIQIQYATMLHENRKYKIHTLDELSPLKRIQGGRSIILVNFQGNEIIIFNRALFYYQILQAHNEHEARDLLSNHHDLQNRIDFYSKFKVIGSGYCKDIIYHQFKNQFAIIAGFDDKQKLVEYQTKKQKKGMFKGQAQVKINISANPTKYRVLVYQKINKQYKVISKSQFFSSRTYKIYSFGSFYGYSMIKQKGSTFETIQFISSQKEKGLMKQIQGFLNCPENIYVSYCESYYIMSYDKFFIVLKIQENGVISYFRTFEYTILNGYFWQKLFFFLTENGLYFMQIVNEQSIIIKIAEYSKINTISKVIDDIQNDDFEPQHQLLPPGQHQIINIVNMSLVLVNQSGNVILIPLNGFPYIVFCLEIISGIIDQSRNIYINSSKNITHIMKETLTNYGMIAPDLII